MIHLGIFLGSVLMKQIFLSQFIYIKVHTVIQFISKVLRKQIIFNQKSIFIFEHLSNNIQYSWHLLQVLRIFLILTDKLSVSSIEKFLFLYFFRKSILSETFVLKNIYLSVFIEIYNIRTFFYNPYFTQNLFKSSLVLLMLR